MISIENNENDTGINLDFDFARSKNVRQIKGRWAGCEKTYGAQELKSVLLNVAPTRSAQLLVQARNAFEGMVVSYGYAYKLMHL